MQNILTSITITNHSSKYFRHITMSLISFISIEIFFVFDIIKICPLLKHVHKGLKQRRTRYPVYIRYPAIFVDLPDIRPDNNIH